jgi:Domain of unknown function (DUF4357)
VLKEFPSCYNYMRTIRKDLLEQGVLVERDGKLVFTQDRVFNSPSTAASVVLGRANNGRVLWEDENGRTLKDIQREAAQQDSGRGDEPSLDGAVKSSLIRSIPPIRVTFPYA